MPEWSSKLRNLYWMLRYRRIWDSAGRRRFYRYIAKEKRRLVEQVGVDQVRECSNFDQFRGVLTL